jgi:hypothetical protein
MTNLERCCRTLVLCSTDLCRSSTSWTLTTKEAWVVAAGTLPERPVEPGNNISLGDLSIDLSFVKTPQRLTLTVTIAPFNASNDWDFHVYRPR